MTDLQQQETRAPKKTGSGYRRLQNRHRALIDEHEMPKAEHRELLEAQLSLQADVDNLLEQHQRLMQNVRAPGQGNWFEGANLTLGQLAANPEPQACKVMEAALVGLLQSAIALGSRLP